MNNHARFGSGSISPATWARAAAFCGAANSFSGVQLDHLLGPATAAGNTFSVSNSLRLYADAGTTVVFHVAVETATGNVSYVLASLSGYLVDA